MYRLGTDVVALAAILGSAAVGGAVTLAALDGGEPRTIVVAPKVHVRAADRCGVVIVDGTVRADLDRALAELDESRAKLERVYERDLERRLNDEMARLEKELPRLGNEVGR